MYSLCQTEVINYYCERAISKPITTKTLTNVKIQLCKYCRSMNMHIYSKINKVIFMVNRHLFNQLFSSNSNCLEIFVKKKVAERYIFH